MIVPKQIKLTPCFKSGAGGPPSGWCPVPVTEEAVPLCGSQALLALSEFDLGKEKKKQLKLLPSIPRMNG